MENEKWEDIPGYEGIYQASNFGRVRTHINKTTYTNRHGVRHWKQRILKYKGVNKRTGYRVDLWKDGKCKSWLVARLVCMTFYSLPKSNKMTVNHKDGDRFNNHIYNLEWLTIGDNIRHGFETGLYHTQHEITLMSQNGDKKTFRSLALASISLGRSKNYVYGQIKRNHKITDVNKNLYTIL